MIAALHAGGVTPLSIGGDHLVSYPILRALGARRPSRHDPRGRPQRHRRHLFRRPEADPRHAVPPRDRGRRAGSEAHGPDRHPRQMYAADERDWALEQGIRIIDMEEVADNGIALRRSPRRGASSAGADLLHLRHRLASIRPSRPAPARPRSAASPRREALQLVRGFRHLDLVGADMVEVSPPLDQSGEHGARRRRRSPSSNSVFSPNPARRAGVRPAAGCAPFRAEAPPGDRFAPRRRGSPGPRRSARRTARAKGRPAPRRCR